jgi:XTP/dITP diphosphohydrolase
MKILIGTNNGNKLTQFRRIFKKHIPEAELFSLADIKIEQDVEEDADTLLKNAKKKAKFFGDLSQMITLADDTGLFIDALNGEPGIHARRWHAGTEADRNKKILERMKNIPEKQRACRYKGVIAIYNPEKNSFWIYEGSLEGKVSEKIVKGLGFGYDPIFITKAYGKYYSELSDKERDAISHRGMGIRELANNKKLIIS